jgi:hypothetical protein
MAASDITVAALTAAPTLRGNKCAWTYSDPRANALPNIGLDMVEVHASTTNDRATATKVGEGITDFLHAGLVEEQTWYYWVKARDYLGGYGSWYPSGSTAGISATAIGMAGLVFGLANGKLVVTENSPSANQLTVAVKAADGNDPSAANPVYLAFRNAAVATGSYSIIALTAALSLTISAGSTMGGRSGLAFGLKVVVFNDGGTPRLGVKNCSNGLAIIYPLLESGIASAVAEGGAGAADSAGVIYASQAISAKSFRILAYLEWSGGFAGTAGNWSTAPSVNRLFGPGMPTPGNVVQAYSETNVVSSTTTSIIPLDNTTPQSSEGFNLATTASITPQSASNFIELDILINVAHSVASGVICAVFRDSETDAQSAGWAQVSAANAIAQVVVRDRFPALDTAARTYTVRIGPALAGTLTINGVSGAGSLNSRLVSIVRISELQG